MNESIELSKLEIAKRQIETALQLFFENKDLVSVITLAGASEEILGKALHHKGERNVLIEFIRAVQAVHEINTGTRLDEKSITSRANIARNELKHFGDPAKSKITISLKREATDMLDRAVANYFSLTTEETELMLRFKEWQLHHLEEYLGI